jgi:hypothetical protein
VDGHGPDRPRARRGVRRRPERILGRSLLLPNILTGTALTLQWADPVPVDDALLDELTDFVLAALLAEPAHHL